MSLWKKKSEKKYWLLTCSKCGASFEVGNDAHIVTDEDMFSMFDSVIVFGQPTRKPDRVGPASGQLTHKQWKEAAASMRSVISDIRAGNPRSWTHQGGCEAVNEYPF